MFKPLEIVRGLSMPFFPMQPTRGRTLRTPRLVTGFWKDVQKDEGWWLVQPKLNGDRVSLAVVNDQVYIQNDHGKRYRRQVLNQADFLKLPNRTCLDGEIWQGNFYPFEALAVDGKSFLPATAAEREVVAFQLSRLLCHPWMYTRPDWPWLMKRWHHLPQYVGVVKKLAKSTYELADGPAQTSGSWLQRLWDNRSL